MNRKIVRFLFALVLVFGAVGSSALPAQADSLWRGENYYNNTWEFPGVCAFPIIVTSDATERVTGHFDNDGNLRDFTLVYEEANTYAANGKSLTGLPVTYTVHVSLDSSGNPTSWFSTGGSYKTRLPNGKLFNASGLIDFMNHPGEGAVLSPDRGNPGDVEALCAALAP